MMAYITWHAAGASANPITFIFHKVQRVLPALAGALLVVMAFPHTYGAGPLFMHGYANVTAACEKNWWKELVFLSNTNEANDSVLSTSSETQSLTNCYYPCL